MDGVHIVAPVCMASWEPPEAVASAHTVGYSFPAIFAQCSDESMALRLQTDSGLLEYSGYIFRRRKY